MSFQTRKTFVNHRNTNRVFNETWYISVLQKSSKVQREKKTSLYDEPI